MTEDLIVTFGKGDGGTHDWKYKGLDPDLPVPKIKEACELLTKLDICTEKGVNLFDSIVTAKVVTTIDTLIFDPEHETKGLTYYGKPAQEPTCEEVRCFEITEEATAQPKEKERLITPPVPLLGSVKQTLVRPLTDMVEVKNTEKKDFPRVELTCPTLEKHEQETVLPTSSSQQQPVYTPTNRKEGWLKRFFSRTNRNKEDPPILPRE